MFVHILCTTILNLKVILTLQITSTIILSTHVQKTFLGRTSGTVIQINKIQKSAPGDGIGESPPALMRKLVNPSLGY